MVLAHNITQCNIYAHSKHGARPQHHYSGDLPSQMFIIVVQGAVIRIYMFLGLYFRLLTYFTILHKQDEHVTKEIENMLRFLWRMITLA